MQLHDAVERFLLQIQADGRAESTVRQYRVYLGVLGAWLAEQGLPTEVEAITHEHVARFLLAPAARCRPDGQVKKATAANVVRSKLRTFFAYLEDASYVGRSPARLVRRAKCGPPPPRTLGEADCRKLQNLNCEKVSNVSKARDSVLFALLLETGLRIGSAVSLAVEDIDWDAGLLWLRHAKGDRVETAVLPAATAGKLRKYLAGRTTGPVFPGAAGRPLGTRQARRRLAQACKAAGMTRVATPHMLRHTFAAALYQRTGDLLLVQRALGHLSPTSTTVYATVGQERLRAALAG